MEKKHRDAIQKNFSSLVEQTDLDVMVSALYEKGVFSEPMIEPYKDTLKDARSRKRKLYLDIMRRGPHAFSHLLDALMENGYWGLVRDLDPDSILHPQPSKPQAGAGFLSIFDKKRRNTGKEQQDPNEKQVTEVASTSSMGGDSRVDQLNEASESAACFGAGAGDAAGSEPAGTTGCTGGTDPAPTPPFDVIKSTKFVDDNGDKLYWTRSRNRGVLVMFSYINFKYNIESERAGAKVDIDNMKYLFSEMGFKVLSYTNLDLQTTRKTLSELKNGICGERPDTIFVVFSSHGYARHGTGDTDIRCYDGQLISYLDITDYFNNVRFPALKGIPKVFIFQTCRGSKEHTASHPRSPDGRRRSRSTPRAGGGGGDMGAGAGGAGAGTGSAPGRTMRDGTAYEEARLPDYAHYHHADKRLFSDILIANSTVPGYTSNRDRELGSWYIQALCSVFAARAHCCHVDELLTAVDEQLGARFGPQTSAIERWGFNRLLYLHPGLFQ